MSRVEYKIEIVAQWWSTRGLAEKASGKANDLARDGWKLVKMTQGWNAFLLSCIYMAFERVHPE